MLALGENRHYIWEEITNRNQIEKAITLSFKSLILESANNPVKGAT